VSGEFEAVVHAQQLGRASRHHDDAVQDPHGAIRVDGAVDLDGEHLPCELGGVGEDIQRPQIGGLVQEEVDGPDLVEAHRSQSGGRHGGDIDPVAPSRAPEHATFLVTA
jgi:hypothetical protein